MKLTKIAFVVASLAASTLASAVGQTSANFAMPKDSINNGVGQMSSVNFTLSSSVGDAVATGNITSVSFVLASGFRGQISVSSAVLNLLSVVSRKLHGATRHRLTARDHARPVASGACRACASFGRISALNPFIRV